MANIFLPDLTSFNNENFLFNLFKNEEHAFITKLLQDIFTNLQNCIKPSNTFAMKNSMYKMKMT